MTATITYTDGRTLPVRQLNHIMIGLSCPAEVSQALLRCAISAHAGA